MSEWVARARRYGEDYEEQLDSLDEALSYADMGVEYGSHSVGAIVSPDGQVIDGSQYKELSVAYDGGTERLTAWLEEHWPEAAVQRRKDLAREDAEQAADHAERQRAIRHLLLMTAARFSGGVHPPSAWRGLVPAGVLGQTCKALNALGVSDKEIEGVLASGESA